MTLMFNDDEENINLPLHDSDYPDNFKNKTHPEDYIIATEHICDMIFHMKKGHNRLLLRISFKIGPQIYVPMTFVCDTGACTSLYFCKRAKEMLKTRILIDELDNEYVELKDGKKLAVEDTVYNHENVNIIGLKALCHFELFLNSDYTFGFGNLPTYF